jgi:hypothetical protein
LENRREWMKCGIRIRHDAKELEAKNQELYSLKAKLSEKNKKKVEAYQRILELKKLYNEEVMLKTTIYAFIIFLSRKSSWFSSSSRLESRSSRMKFFYGDISVTHFIFAVHFHINKEI